MINITNASKELSVSRTKIYKEIERLKIKPIKKGKNNFISDDDFKQIKKHIVDETTVQNQYDSNTTERTKNVLGRDRSMIIGELSDREYVDLKERIQFLEEQIKTKDGQLQAKDFQINGLIQSNFNFSKSLTPGNEIAVTEEENKKDSWISRLFTKNH